MIIPENDMSVEEIIIDYFKSSMQEVIEAFRRSEYLRKNKEKIHITSFAPAETYIHAYRKLRIKALEKKIDIFSYDKQIDDLTKDMVSVKIFSLDEKSYIEKDPILPENKNILEELR